MFWTVLAIVMTVFMGGIIAYNGDLIGRKYGKRRTKILGLRPKHSAIIITSVTGGAISLLTILALFALVPPIRRIILDGETAIRLSKELKTENDSLTQQKTTNLAKVAQGEAQLKLINGQLAESRLSLDKMTKLKNVEQEKLNTLSARYSVLQSKLIIADSKLHIEQRKYSELRKAQSSLLASNAKLSTKNLDLVTLNTDLSAENVRQSAVNATLTTKNASLVKQNSELSNQSIGISDRNLELNKINLALDKEIATRTKVADVYKRTNDLLRGQVEELDKTRNKLTDDNRMLSEIVNQLTPGYKSIRDAFLAARNGRVAIHKDEDIARVVIPANSSPDQVRKLLADLLHSASGEALRKGASANDSARAVQVVSRQVVEQRGNGQLVGLEITPEDRVDAVVSRLAWSTSSNGVLALAVSNSVTGEPAAIDFQPFPNRKVYSKGELVAQRTINSNASADLVFTEIGSFLASVGGSAMKDGIIPRLDPTTGQMQIGSLDGAEVVKLVEKLRDYGGRVKLKAIARRDLSSADTLDVEYVLGR